MPGMQVPYVFLTRVKRSLISPLTNCHCTQSLTLESNLHHSLIPLRQLLTLMYMPRRTTTDCGIYIHVQHYSCMKWCLGENLTMRN